MLDRIGVLLGIMAIAGLGNWLIRKRLRELEKRRERAIDFHNKLMEYFESGGRDSAAYAWLTQRSTRMQNEMGSHGVMAQFRPPFANFMFRNWPIVLNALSEMQQALRDSFLFEQAAAYAQILRDALLRYGGALDDRIEEVRRDASNPVSSFREGINAIVRLPLYLLYWLGLRSAVNLSSGPLGRLVAGLVALITLASAVVSLVVGWEAFWELTGSLW